MFATSSRTSLANAGSIPQQPGACHMLTAQAFEHWVLPPRKSDGLAWGGCAAACHFNIEKRFLVRTFGPELQDRCRYMFRRNGQTFNHIFS